MTNHEHTTKRPIAKAMIGMTNNYDNGDRRQVVLPSLTLAAFASRFGVTVPSGVPRYWEQIACWQFAGLATVEIAAASGEMCGIVQLTTAGRSMVAWSST